MTAETQESRRRTVLKAVGISVVGSGTLVGSGTAQENGNGGPNGDEDLIDVDPTELTLEEGETGEVTVEIQGPPFGRTDVVVSGAPADPGEFRLQGENDSTTVELGPVEEDTTVEFEASTPAGDEQVATVEISVEVADPLLEKTDADTIVEPVVEFGEEDSEDQFNALEELDLTDPFTLAVEASGLAEEDSTDYAVTAYYDEFGEAPNDRLAGPSVPLSFDEQGIASVTIGSAGTDADVTTGLAPGALSGDATLVNQIEVPAGSERFAVQTEGSGASVTAEPSDSDSGEFTEQEEV